MTWKVKDFVCVLYHLKFFFSSPFMCKAQESLYLGPDNNVNIWEEDRKQKTLLDWGA